MDDVRLPACRRLFLRVRRLGVRCTGPSRCLPGGGGHLPAFVVPMVAACFDLVVHCRRRPGRPREVEEIRAVGTRGENGVIEASPLFHRVDGDLITGGSEVPAPEKCALAGVCTEQVRECQSRDHDDGSGR